MGYLDENGLAALTGKIKGQTVELTYNEYLNLPDTKLTDNKLYFVTDGEYAYVLDDEPTENSDNLVKSGGVYNYTSKIGSGTLNTTAQTIIPAINELKNGLTDINSNLTTINGAMFIVTSTAGVPIKLPCRSGHGVYLLVGFQQGWMPVTLRIRASNGTVTVVNLTDGSAYSFGSPVVTYSNDYISVTDSYGSSKYVFIGTSA